MGRNIQAGGLVIDSTNPSEIGRYMKDISREQNEKETNFIKENGINCQKIKLRKNGSSIGITIPIDAIKKLNLKPGELIDITVIKSE